MTKICIYGAGAIGGYLASALDQAGAEVSLVARGPHLKAIQEKGLRFEKDGKIFTHHLPASENPNEFGPQDFVLIAIKAHGIPKIAHNLIPLLGSETAVVSAVNGLPWWYFHWQEDGV